MKSYASIHFTPDGKKAELLTGFEPKKLANGMEIELEELLKGFR